MRQELLTNDNTTLVPKTSFDGPVLEFDFPALHIGVAEYEEGPTGCTVFYFPEGATAAADIRGGDCATVQTQHLEAGDRHSALMDPLAQQRGLAKSGQGGDEGEPATQTGVQPLDQARARD